MALTATTTSGAITGYQTRLPITSTTGATAPVFPTGSGFTWAFCENEMMFVTAVPSTTLLDVIRGVLGTKAVAHVTASPIIFGGASDYPLFQAQIGAFQTELLSRDQGMSAAVAAAATIVAPGPIFHVTGTTATANITPPSNFVGGKITIIADGAWTWTSTTTANGIAMAGAATSAGTAVTFFYDPGTTYWYADRRA